MFERFTDRARRVVVLAQDETRRLSHRQIGTGHLLLGLLAEKEGIASRSLVEEGLTIDTARSFVQDNIAASSKPPSGHIPFTQGSKKTLEAGLREALTMGYNYIGTEHILLGLLKSGGLGARVVEETSNGADSVRQTVRKHINSTRRKAKTDERRDDAMAGGGRASRSAKTILDHCGRNLTAAAEDGHLDPLIGRTTELERMMQILGRRTKNNPVLIGEPGVGKSAIVEGLAQKIAAGSVPRSLAGKTIYTLDLGTLVAGTRFRGDFEERLKRVLKEIKKQRNVVLFMDEIHTVVGAGAAAGAIDAASILKPLLARGELQTIGATTSDEYRKYFERDSALARRFHPIRVEEPSVEDTIEILMGLKGHYEHFHQVRFDDAAVVLAARLADRYISDRFLPDKAIDLIDEAGSHKKLYGGDNDPETEQLRSELSDVRRSKRNAVEKSDYETAAEMRDRERALIDDLSSHTTYLVGGDDIADVLEQWTGVPVRRVTEQETSRLMNMEAELHERIVGQDEAIEAVSRSIRRTRAGLKDPRRPSGSFVFLGPSGVGKTETAKALTEFLFGKEESLLQFDMSEYMEKHAVSRLVGSPPGYVGYHDGGQLTEGVRRRPFSVVLFDEIEKAHPDVFNLLLQILEDGHLTDAHGKTVDFKNTIIVMTSNLGTKTLRRKAIGFRSDSPDVSYDMMRERLVAGLKKHFRPEFLNRLDEVIVFRELTVEEIKQIIDRLLVRLVDQLKTRNIDLVVADSAKEWLAVEGHDRELGARPLRRAIQRHLEDPISEKILRNRVSPGSTVLVAAGETGTGLTIDSYTTGGVPAGVA